MYIFIFLFFISLLGIAFMIGRKLTLLQAGRAQTTGETIFEIPQPEEIKNMTVLSAKKVGFVTLVITIKLYVKTTNFFKRIVEETKKLKNKHLPRKEKGVAEKKDSGFLNAMSEYKQKIRELKHKIHEEENGK